MKIPFETQGALKLRSPAKITPWMHVLSRRRDGFHEVRVCLVAVSLWDRLEFRRMPDALPGTGCSLGVTGSQDIGPMEDNLVMRAARAVEAALGAPLPCAIHLDKSIPAGAGLGGGSGNAAVTLLALNHLAGSPLGNARLAEIALALGSDVPFFLDPRPALATGRGERLQPLPAFPAVSVLIVKPPLSIPTPTAYARVTPRHGPGESPPPAEPPRLDTLDDLLPLLENDFEAPLFADHPELAAIKAHLLELGAAGALLSGSGSALFGLFRDAATRDRAAKTLRQEGRWRVWACETLRARDYGLA